MKKLVCTWLYLIFIFPLFVMNSEAADDGQDMNIYGIYLSAEGDATLIESDGQWLLIDTGHEESSDELVRKIKEYNITELDVLISHLHSDHTGGVEKLANSDIKINHLYLPDDTLTPYDPNTVSKQNKQIKKVQDNNPEAVITELKKGDELSFGDVIAKVLGPVSNVTLEDFEDTETQTALEKYVNCRSLTIKFECGKSSFISAGDIEEQEENALVKKYKDTDELNADIMKLSHHALYTSNTEAFLKEVSPKYSFAHNSGKTINAGSNYRMYYNSCKNASQYGPVYLIGDEKKDFRAKVSDGEIDIFKGSEELKGLVSLTGGDGTVVKTNKYYITDDAVNEGVYTIDGKKYYIFDGGLVNTAFYSFNLKKYVYRYEPVDGGDVRYFDLDGVMYTGFHKINDNYFYFDTNTGLLLKGDENFTPVSIGKNKYAINENGAVYNYGEKSGAWKKYGSNYRYFDAKGVMKTGWATVSGKKYYLDPVTGLRTIGLKTVDGKTYYFIEKNNAGYAYNAGWKNFNSQYRYFDKEGVMKTGWQTIDGKRYYLDKTTGYRATGMFKDGSSYYYVKNGILKGSEEFEKCNNAYLALSKTTYTYSGKSNKPSVLIRDAKGNEISSKYYTVKYASGRKKVGKYKVTVKFKGKYSGTGTLYFKINPAKTTVSKLTAGKKSLKVKISKKSSQVTGYQLQYSTSKKFTDSATKTQKVKSYKTTSVTLKNLKAKKTYYVRVRTYKTVSGKTYYSGWSEYTSKKTM